MSDQNKTSSTELLRKSGAELLKDFGVQKTVDASEFGNVIQFTKEDLKNLRESMKQAGNNEDQKIETLRRFMEIKKQGLRFEVLSGAVQEQAKMKQDQLRNQLKASEGTKIPLPEKEVNLLESPWKWAKENPIKGTALALGTAFVGYKALSWIGGMFSGSESSDSKKDDPKESFITSMLEKVGIKGEYAKWAKNFGILGLVAAAGIGIFMGKDKIMELFGKAGEFFGIVPKEKKEAIEKIAQKYQISEGLLNKIQNEKIGTFLSPVYGDVISKAKNFVGDATGLKTILAMIPGIPDLTNEEIVELSKLREHIKKLQSDKQLSYKEKSTIADFCIVDSGGQIKDEEHKVSILSNAEKQAGQDVAANNLDSSKTDSTESEVNNGILATAIRFLMGGAATNEERGLGARVLQYTAKAHYMKMLYNRYISAKGLSTKVGATRLDALNNLENGRWKQIQEMEKRGGFGTLLETFNNAKINGNIEVIKSTRKELEAYLKQAGEFDKEFERIVRNAKFPKRSAEGADLLPQIEEYKKLRTSEAEIQKQVQELGMNYEKQAQSLVETAKKEAWTAEKLAKEQQTLSNEFGKWVSEFQKDQRVVQGELKGVVENLSKSQMGARTLEKEGGITMKVMPNGTIKLALIGATIASIGFSSGWDKKKMGWMVGEAAGAFIPGVNMFLDGRQIWTGTDLAGNQLGKWERWGLAPAFLTLDTIGTVATFFGGYPALAAIAGLKDVVVGGRVIKGAKAAEEAVKVAHVGEDVTKVARLGEEAGKMIESIKGAGVGFVDTLGAIKRVPPNFMNTYREGVAAAHNSGWFQAAKPLANVAKFAVYGSLGYSVCTGVASIGEYIVGGKKIIKM